MKIEAMHALVKLIAPGVMSENVEFKAVEEKSERITLYFEEKPTHWPKELIAKSNSSFRQTRVQETVISSSFV